MEARIRLLENLKDVTAKDYIKPMQYVVDAETPIWKLMETATYTPGREIFFVMKDGKCIGMISVFKILKWMLLRTRAMGDLTGKIDIKMSEVLGANVRDYMEGLVTVSEDDTIMKAVREMIKNNVNVIAVTTYEGDVIGEIDYRTILELAIKVVTIK